ncbi:unnamed protein product, partial [Urochloa humidicola]
TAPLVISKFLVLSFYLPSLSPPKVQTPPGAEAAGATAAAGAGAGAAAPPPSPSLFLTAAEAWFRDLVAGAHRVREVSPAGFGTSRKRRKRIWGRAGKGLGDDGANLERESKSSRARTRSVPPSSPRRGVLQRAPSRRHLLGARAALVDERDDGAVDAGLAEGVSCKKALHVDGQGRPYDSKGP